MSSNFLTDEQFKKLADAVENVQLFYGNLSKKAQQERKKLWSETPKLHFFWHLGQQGKFLNPKVFWTYMSEDFVGKISKLASSLLNGLRVYLVSQKLAQQYRMALHFWLSWQWPQE